LSHNIVSERFPCEEADWFPPNERSGRPDPEPAAVRLAAARDQYGDRLIGVWEITQLGIHRTLVLHEDPTGVALEMVYTTGRVITLRFDEQPASDGRRFVDPANSLDVYWVLRDGSLEFWRASGMDFRAQPLNAID
jgi:hypothetical protein